jgi:hypothetical protein
MSRPRPGAVGYTNGYYNSSNGNDEYDPYSESYNALTGAPTMSDRSREARIGGYGGLSVPAEDSGRYGNGPSLGSQERPDYSSRGETVGTSTAGDNGRGPDLDPRSGTWRRRADRGDRDWAESSRSRERRENGGTGRTGGAGNGTRQIEGERLCVSLGQGTSCASSRGICDWPNAIQSSMRDFDAARD